MPLYVYKCAACGLEFEELVSKDKRDESQVCKDCGKDSKREEVTSFAINTTLDPKKDTIYSPKEIDKVVGAKAEETWQGYDERWKKRYKDRQEKRWNGKKPGPVNIPKDPDGKYSPLMHLGGEKEKETRKEFSEALQEHRAEREKKGLSQFDGPGAIEE